MGAADRTVNAKQLMVATGAGGTLEAWTERDGHRAKT